jgi:hypothetical protein
VAGTVKLEKLGIPGTFINCNTFNDDALSAASDSGMPGVRHVVISSADFYRVRATTDLVRPMVESIFDEIVADLTKPLTKVEASVPEPADEIDGPPHITIEKASYEDAFEEFNRLYLENRWGDGLPLVPPTPERVKWMLAGTRRSPQEILGTIRPKSGTATVEKIAVNAVMAGAKPEYFPVILAAMDVLTNPDYDDLHVLASAGSFNLIIVVTGPIAKEIGMHGGIGFIGHGFRANNTIGRAVRLSTLNIGRTWPGANDMALTGRISPHTFFTFPENFESTTWEPYHATRGFKAADSCVTVANIFSVSPMQHFFGGVIGTWSAKEVLDRLVDNVVRMNRNAFPNWGVKGVGSIPGSGGGANNHFVMLFPALAAELNKLGYDRPKLQQAVYDRAAVAFEELKEADVTGIKNGIRMGVVPPDRARVFETALKPGGKVPVLVTPESLHFFVAGGDPGAAFAFNYLRLPPYNKLGIMTRKITGATQTKAGA